MRMTRVSSQSRRNSGPPRAAGRVPRAFGLQAGGGREGPDSKATSNASVPGEVASPRHPPITANYSGTATLQAVGQASVVAKTTGIVRELPAEEGMYVNK